MSASRKITTPSKFWRSRTTNAWYQAKLAARHRRCPIGADQRMWTAADIAKAERGN